MNVSEIIKDLVERYSFDFKTLLQDESMDLVTLGYKNKHWFVTMFYFID